MNTTNTYDTVVIGAGLAGLVTGLRLAESGVRVCVLEKGGDERYMCNSRMTGGAFHVAFRDVKEDKASLLNAINTRTRGYAAADLADAVASDIGNVVEWLKAKGVRFIKVGHEVHRQHTLAPPIMIKGRDYWHGRGGDVMLRTLGAAFRQHAGVFMSGTRASRLVVSDGRCVGVEYEQDGRKGELRASSVVVCDGGYQANHALLREFISPAPEMLCQRNARTGDGDGLRMARDIGAQLVGTDRIYGHLLAQDAMHNDNLSPFPIVDFICTAGLVVDRTGQRFVDEGMGGVYMVNRIAALQDPLAATVIFDQAIWDGPGREFISPANPQLVTNGATLEQAPDLAGLCSKLGLPAGSLDKTVAAFNAAVDDGATAGLVPVRTAVTYKPLPIRAAPFYAVRLCAGVTYTMGGLKTDGSGRVLGVAGPIAGLYAAGCAAGGLEGGEFAGYVGGLTKSSTMAFRVANHIIAGRAAAA